MLWVVVGCFCQFINSVVWANDALIRVPVWCDISTCPQPFIHRTQSDTSASGSHINIGFAVAIPACSLAINRRLYKAVSVSATTILDNKRRDAIIDLAICVGIPLVQIGIYIVNQGHRFDVYEELGCMSALYVTWPAIFMALTWPLAIGCGSAIYTILIINTFMRRRSQFNRMIESNPSLDMSRYWRLMALASMDIVFTIPLALYFIAIDASNGIRPWVSWANVHFDFGQINQWPSIQWRTSSYSVAAFEVERWSYILCAVTFFAFFGLNSQARANYKSAFLTLTSFAGYSGRTTSTTRSRAVFIPTVSALSNDPVASTHYMYNIDPYTGADEKAKVRLSSATMSPIHIQHPFPVVLPTGRGIHRPHDMV
jgi:pheromone a factor receptor